MMATSSGPHLPTNMSIRGPRKSAAAVASSSSRCVAGPSSSSSSSNCPSTSTGGGVGANMYLTDYNTDYDSEVARLMPIETATVNSSDTEDASEDGDLRDDDLYDDEIAGPSGMGSSSATAIKEQVYLDKLEQLKSDLRELEEGTHPEFLAEFHKIEKIHHERERACEIEFQYGNQLINNDFVNEQRAALREFEEKKSDLKENLLVNLMKQKELIESERYANELSLDPTDLKPPSTRKLRRRPNDPVPVPEKRRKATQSQITFLLDDNEVIQDLNIIRAGEGGVAHSSPSKKSAAQNQQSPNSPVHISSQSGSKSPSPIPNSDTRIEDGKLFYEKRWFHRGQQIYLEGKEMLRIIGVIGGISHDAVWVRKVGDNGSKLRVPLIHLMKGKCTIKRRA